MGRFREAVQAQRIGKTDKGALVYELPDNKYWYPIPEDYPPKVELFENRSSAQYDAPKTRRGLLMDRNDKVYGIYAFNYRQRRQAHIVKLSSKQYEADQEYHIFVFPQDVRVKARVFRLRRSI